MKKILLFTVMQIFCCITLSAQVGINTQQSINIQPNTIYQVDASDKGVLFPRMTTAQRNAISTNPSEMPNGLIVYDTNLNCLLYWSSLASAWKGHCEKGLAKTTPAANVPATNTPGNNPIIP